MQGGFAEDQGRCYRINPEFLEGDNTASCTIDLIDDTEYLINPGSVGQPRDRDPRAAYALYDSDARTVTLRRVEYPIAQTAESIRQAGLPDVLGLRLFSGF